MCRLKSGIIFKNRCVVAPADNDSHSDLLRDLDIEDTYTNASRIFVRAELAPANNEWWTDPDGWNFVVDQDVTPDWYDTDPGKYEEEFRQAVKAWWEEHVIVDKKIDELSSGYYRLKWCEVKRLLNDVKVYLDQSKVGEMWDSSQVGKMRGSSQVGEMWGSSQVGEMCGSSQVGEMWDSSQVGKMRESSTVRDFKNWPNVKIHIPKNGEFELVKHEEESE